MTNEETRPEGTQQQFSDTSEPENRAIFSEAYLAKLQFSSIKKALIGTDPKWLLPKVNAKAQENKP